MVGDLTVAEAIRVAKDASLDLVEVSPQADPPVCRLLDYGKYKYLHQHQRHGGAKHRASKLKELRLRPNTDMHDIGVRIKQARKFLERGDRVLVTMIFRGREMVHIANARDTLAHFAEQLADVAKVEKEPSMEPVSYTHLTLPTN